MCAGMFVLLMAGPNRLKLTVATKAMFIAVALDILKMLLNMLLTIIANMFLHSSGRILVRNCPKGNIQVVEPF